MAPPGWVFRAPRATSRDNGAAQWERVWPSVRFASRVNRRTCRLSSAPPPARPSSRPFATAASASVAVARASLPAPVAAVMADSKPLTGAEGTPADTKPATDDAGADGTGSSEQVNIKVRLTWMVVLSGCARFRRGMGDGEDGSGVEGGGEGSGNLRDALVPLSPSCFERPSMSRGRECAHGCVFCWEKVSHPGRVSLVCAAVAIVSGAMPLSCVSSCCGARSLSLSSAGARQ